jgi:hypothetical protein
MALFHHRHLLMQIRIAPVAKYICYGGIVEVTGVGSLTVAAAVWVQPFASVTVTV